MGRRQSKGINADLYLWIALTLAERGANTLKNIFKFPTHTKPSDENIMQLILPSILGIILCMICLCGTTWAWFSGVMATGTATVQAANYTVEAQVTGDNSGEVEPNADGSFSLSPDDTYQVSLTIGGTATETSGYCRVTMPTGEMYYTDSMRNGDTISFSVTNTEGDFTVLALWGTYSGGVTLRGGETITGSAQLPDSNSIEPADTTAAPETTEAVTTTDAAPEETTSTETTAASETTAAPEETTGLVEETTASETTAAEPSGEK